MWRSGTRLAPSSSSRCSLHQGWRPSLRGLPVSATSSTISAATRAARPLSHRVGGILITRGSLSKPATSSTPSSFSFKRHSANKSGNENNVGQIPKEPIRLDTLGKTPEEAAKPLRAAENGSKTKKGTARRVIKYVLLGSAVGIGVATFAFLNQSEPATPRQVRFPSLSSFTSGIPEPLSTRYLHANMFS